MQRHLLVGAVLSALLTASLPAHAGPFAGIADRAEFVGRLKGSDGKMYGVSLVAYSERGATNTSWLQVTLSRCKAYYCSPFATYLKTLEEGELSVEPDASAASLKTTFAGAPLEIDWSLGPATSFDVTAGTKTSVFRHGGASVGGVLFGPACTGTGDLGSEIGFEAERDAPGGAPEPKRLSPGLHASRGAPINCG